MFIFDAEACIPVFKYGICGAFVCLGMENTHKMYQM